MKKFERYEEYESWTEQFENTSDYQGYPVLIDDGWKIAADMFAECKSWKTALRRFSKEFSVIPEISEWLEGIKESCENGCFESVNGWHPAWTNNPEEVKKIAENGIYSYGIEEVSEGYWYIFLNISGSYANRKRESV